MECNKDEAMRARQIAEGRMQRGEFVDALKFATKAKRLFANVESIDQILTVCEVHIASQKKLSGSDFMDWYAILQTESFADEATVKKQYRRLALLLHPDKNKFAGAEAAFKLIGQASEVLSDQAKRSLFDKIFETSVKIAAFKASHHDTTGFDDHTGQMTFWTSCQHCKMKFQYIIRVINANLRCQRCRNPFKAHVISVGFQGVSPSMFTKANIPKEAPMHGTSKPASENSGGKPLRREHTGTSVRSHPTSMKKCAAGVANSKDSNVPASRGMEPQTSQNVGSKRVRQSAPDSARNSDEMKDANVRENAVDSARRSSGTKQHVSYVETSEDDGSEIPSKKPRQNGPLNTDEVEKQNVPTSGGGSSYNNFPATSGAAGVAGQNNREKVSESNIGLGVSKEDKRSPLNSNVPSGPGMFHCTNADFNDFEKHKEEDCFAVNQLWAVYDSNDMMPRFYALVKKVASPFQLKIIWLEPDSDDQGEIDWDDAELPIACGKFRLGGSQKTTDSTIFSHQVACVKETGKGSYLVCPNKGETWALFRDWDIKWSSNPEKHLKYDFEYVEILYDFAENVGIAVAYLCKVKGFVSLFQRTEEIGRSIFYVRPNELYRFSHRIPSCKMSGYERGCSKRVF